MGVNNQPTISVVMSVYNSEAYLSEAIESIINQTYGDFEFIIVNDGSTDLSLEIIEKYASLDNRIRVVSRENHGLAYSLNESIRLARGEWIARMDSDDISLPSRFENQLLYIRKTGVDICGGAAKLIGYKTRQVWYRDETDSEIKLRLCFSSSFIHPTIMMRSELAKKYCYDESYEQAQDYELWTRISAAGYKMANTSTPLLLYRVHKSQISQKNEDTKILYRDRLQRAYISRMISTPGAFQVMNKFSDPRNRPSIEDAKILFDIMLDINWASAIEKNAVFQSLLKYVKPAGMSVYNLGQWCCKRFGLNPSFSATLFVQSILGLDSDSRAYHLIKRFIK